MFTLKKIIKNLKGSQLVEKILIAAFSVSAGAAVTVYGVSVIQNSKSAQIDEDDINDRTYGYNQLAKFNDRDYTMHGVRFVCEDDLFTITGEGTSDYYTGLAPVGLQTIVSHKYYISCGGYDLWLYLVGAGEAQQGEGILTASSADTRISFKILNNKVYDYKGYINLIDLTMWYGAGNEPSSVSEFKAKFPNEHYPFQSTPLELTKTQINNL